MTGSNKFFLLSRRLFEGKQRSRRAHTRIADLRLAWIPRSTPLLLGRTNNQCIQLNFTWQAGGGSVSSPSSASSAKPQWRCAAATACVSSAQARHRADVAEGDGLSFRGGGVRTRAAIIDLWVRNPRCRRKRSRPARSWYGTRAISSGSGSGLAWVSTKCSGSPLPKVCCSATSWHFCSTANCWMDSNQKLVEKLVERRMQNTGESQAVATANVMAAFEKLRKDKD